MHAGGVIQIKNLEEEECFAIKIINLIFPFTFYNDQNYISNEF